MKLNDYMIKNKISTLQLALELGFSEISIHRYRKLLVSPSLQNAAKIYIWSNGEVDYLDMIPPRFFEDVANNISKK